MNVEWSWLEMPLDDVEKEVLLFEDDLGDWPEKKQCALKSNARAATPAATTR